MPRTSNEKREIFLRLYQQGKKPVEIAEIINVARQTVTGWILKIKDEGD